MSDKKSIVEMIGKSMNRTCVGKHELSVNNYDTLEKKILSTHSVELTKASKMDHVNRTIRDFHNHIRKAEIDNLQCAIVQQTHWSTGYDHETIKAFEQVGYRVYDNDFQSPHHRDFIKYKICWGPQTDQESLILS